MSENEQKQLQEILKLDREMRCVDFTLSVIGALIWDMKNDIHRVDMQDELNNIMQRAYGGAE